VQTQIINMMKALQAEMGLTYLFVSHDLGVIANISDRVAVMYAGRIVEMGTVIDVFQQPRHPYTRGLLGSVPRAGAVRTMLSSIEGTPPSLTDLPAGCAFHARCSFATDICKRERPPLQSLGADRKIACFHHDRVAAAEAIL